MSAVPESDRCRGRGDASSAGCLLVLHPFGDRLDLGGAKWITQPKDRCHQAVQRVFRSISAVQQERPTLGRTLRVTCQRYADTSSTASASAQSASVRALRGAAGFAGTTVRESARRGQRLLRGLLPGALAGGQPDQAALDVVAAPVAQQIGRLFVLHPFGD